MANSSGTLYYFGESEGSLSDRVIKAFRQYVMDRHEFPDFVSINFGQGSGTLPESIEIEGKIIPLLFERSCLKNHFFVGNYWRENV